MRPPPPRLTGARCTPPLIVSICAAVSSESSGVFIVLLFVSFLGGTPGIDVTAFDKLIIWIRLAFQEDAA